MPITFTTIEQIRDALEDEGGVPPGSLLAIVNFLWDHLGGGTPPVINIPVLASLRGEWIYAGTATGAPPEGTIAFDADPHMATELRIDNDDRHNDQFRGVLNRLDDKWFLYVQEQDNPDAHLIVKVTGPAVDNADYVTAPVEVVAHGSSSGPWGDLLVTIVGPIAMTTV